MTGLDGTLFRWKPCLSLSSSLQDQAPPLSAGHQVWELLSPKDGSPVVTSASTENARAQHLTSNQETQVLTRELPGVSLEQPAQPWGSGVGEPGLGVCFCGAGVKATAPLPSIPKPHCHLGIWGSYHLMLKLEV